MAFHVCPFQTWATAWILGALGGVAPTATQKVVDVQEMPPGIIGSSAANGCTDHRPSCSTSEKPMHVQGRAVVVLESPTATQVRVLGQETEDKPETTEPVGVGAATIRQEEFEAGVGPPDRKMAASTRANIRQLSADAGRA